MRSFKIILIRSLYPKAKGGILTENPNRIKCSSYGGERMERILSILLVMLFAVSPAGFASVAKREAPAPTPAPTAKPR
ncbi:MAG: hypothetical protein C4291_12360 [Candidatus Dadabacteria bacterium]